MPGGGKVDDLGLARRGLMPLRKKKTGAAGGQEQGKGRKFARSTFGSGQLQKNLLKSI